MITIKQEREILRLANIDKMSHKNIGTRVNVSQVTVSKVILRGYVRRDRRPGNHTVNCHPTPEDIEKAKLEIRRQKGHLTVAALAEHRSFS